MLQPIHSVYDGLFDSVSLKKIDLNRPTVKMIDIDDIATGLSNVCRFGGQIEQHYSVAQHSCLVACIAPFQIKRAALLHDASEAYLGDVIKPLKVMLGDSYATIEERFMRIIFERFEVDYNQLELIKPYDKTLLEAEHEYFRSISKLPLYGLVDKYFPGFPAIWNPQTSKVAFKQLFNNYFKN